MTDFRGEGHKSAPDLSIVESRMLVHPAVADCAVVRRRTESGIERILVYFLASEPVDASELRRHVESPDTPDLGACSFIPISSLPVTEAGETDYEALKRLSVFGPETTESWRTSLGRRCLGPFAVLVDEDQRSRLPLHLADVLSAPVLDRSRHAPASSGEEPGGEAGAEVPPNERETHRPAIADGGVLAVPTDAPTELVEVFRRAAKIANVGIHYRAAGTVDSFESYADLARSADRILAGLRAAGLERGERVLLQLSRPRDFLEAFWAVILGGFVPVPMAVPVSFRQPSASSALERAFRLLDEPAVLAKRDILGEIEGVLHGVGTRPLRALALEDLRREPEPGPGSGAEVEREWHSPDVNDVALLMLTSGSTGVPKAVELTHRNLVRRTLGSIQRNGFAASDVSLNWMPLDHVAGLIYFHLRDTQLRCRQIQLETETVIQKPLAWLDAMDEFRATVSFAPNFAYALLNDCERELRAGRWDLSSVRFVLNGAEAIVARTARRFLRLLEPHGLSPNAMQPAWGMSETSSGVTYSDRFSLATTTDEDAFVEVGRPIPGVMMRIVDGSDRVVDEGMVGALQVRGEVVTRGYFRSETATREALTRDGWFKTGDLGILRDGRLTITGREKDVVIINSVNYYSHAIESAVEEVEGVVTSFTAACAVRDEKHDTDRLAVFFHPSSFEPDSLRALLKRIRAAVRASSGVGADYLVPVAREAIPKTSLGKIQRSLLSERLTGGDFDPALKTVDRLLAASNTIPDWFFRKTWVRRNGRLQPSPEERHGLVFLDDEGVGRRLAESSRARKLVAVVNAGTSFERLSATEYTIDPARADDYGRLMASLRDDGIDPDWIVHLWTYQPNVVATGSFDSIAAAQTRGSMSLLWLSQAIARTGPSDKPRKIAVVGSHVARVAPSDIVNFENCPLLGFVKSIPQEMPNLRCLHIDLDDRDVSTAATTIAEELRMVPLEREIAHRGEERFVARIARVEFPPGERSEPPFDEGAFYLLSGGLGGIGFEISRYLAAEIGARLLLVGRSRFPLASEGASRLEALTRLSENVAYEPCDVTDGEGLEAVVRKYEARFGRSLDGAVHLAGTYAERLIVEESRESFEGLLAPRALGALRLKSLLEARGGGTLVTFSSLAGFFGGASIASYSAANAFLDGLQEHLEATGSLRSYCFQWSNWDGIGQARGNRPRELPRSLGYLPISTERAMVSMHLGLRRGPGAMLVGLDGDNRRVRRFLHASPENTEKAYIYLGPDDLERLDLGGRDLRDGFGTPVPFEIVSTADLPLDEYGDVDIETLRATSRRRARGAAEGAKPETVAERTLAEVFRQTLGASDVRVDDSFFELGGDSLLAVRALSQIRDRFDVELSLRTVFENPRLGDLARAIEGARKPSSPSSPTLGFGRTRGTDAQSLLERLDELGDEEVDALLGQLDEDDEAMV
jgi:acyl-CoA synthetase (AMP-forming)/AMP-acid ligase II/NADP-dependent 3-hydroxy acid dehydrogenase YdfG/acyl carrier protein